MQSTNLSQIKVALRDQAFIGSARVSPAPGTDSRLGSLVSGGEREH